MVHQMNHDARTAVDVLSENGRHFLRSALDEIARDSDTGNRNAVVFAAAAVEVILKTRLALEHWTLVFEDPSKARLQDLRSGEFISVQASKLIQRLNNVASLDLDLKEADQIFKLRNRMVHFGPGPQIAMRLEVSRGLGFALDFIHNHLLPQLPPEERERFEELKMELTETFAKLDDFRVGRLADLALALTTHPVVVTCPDCQQDTLVVNDDADGDKCLFCLAFTGGEALAERYVSDVLGWSWVSIAEGGEDPQVDCLECPSRALVGPVRVARRPNIAYVCFSCALALKAEEVHWCTSCGELKYANESSICTDCWKNMLAE